MDLAAGLLSNPALVVSRKSDLDDPLLTLLGGGCPRRRPIVEIAADAS
jgi:hypothetical protein